MDRRSLVALAVVLAGCGGGAAAAPTGGAGAGGAAGAGGSVGAGGSLGVAGSVGAAGSVAAAGSGGTGMAGAGQGAGGSAAGTSPTPDAQADALPSAPDGGGGQGGGLPDAGPPPTDAARSNKVLIYAVTTGFRHGSIPAAATALTQVAATFGLTTEIVGGSGAGNVPDPTKLTAAALAQYGAVVLLANSGEPFGYPATQEIQNLIDYVRAGGALVGIEDATHCYDGTFNNHPASMPFIDLVGADFIGHPGDVAPATCTKVGTHPSVAQLPASFKVTDEIYSFSKFRMDNQVVLNCVSSADLQTVRPISWVRTEGAGRYFYTALGHNDAEWTAPLDAASAMTRLVADHVVPALLWAMKR
jgi:hypothetical protein